jgi:hypothetical protein
VPFVAVRLDPQDGVENFALGAARAPALDIVIREKMLYAKPVLIGEAHGFG